MPTDDHVHRSMFEEPTLKLYVFSKVILPVGGEYKGSYSKVVSEVR